MYELLIVDDEEIPRNNLAKYFPWEDNGFHICGQANNGEEALEFMKENVVHVVLTDISMPVMDGICLAERLQQHKNSPCIVFLSAYDDFKYAQNAIRYGVRFYILKPSGFSEIMETFFKIKNELDKKYKVAERPEVFHNEDELMQKVLYYIQKEYKTITLGEISKRLFINTSYLSQFIKLKTEKNFVDLLCEVRMQQARLLLQDSSVKIYNISSMVGYTNPNNFTRAFKAYYNQSPKEYRSSYTREIK